MAVSRMWPQVLVLVTIMWLLVAIASAMVWRSRHAAKQHGETLARRPSEPRRSVLLDALDQELAQLEADRGRGAISAEEYATTKRALEKIRQRAKTNTG